IEHFGNIVAVVISHRFLHKGRQDRPNQDASRQTPESQPIRSRLLTPELPQNSAFQVSRDILSSLTTGWTCSGLCVRYKCRGCANSPYCLAFSAQTGGWVSPARDS